MMLLISWMMSSIPAMILENQSQPSSKVVFIRVPTAVRIFLLHVLQWPFDMLQRRMLQYTCSFRIPPEQKNQQRLDPSGFIRLPQMRPSAMQSYSERDVNLPTFSENSRSLLSHCSRREKPHEEAGERPNADDPKELKDIQKCAQWTVYCQVVCGHLSSPHREWQGCHQLCCSIKLV